MTIRERLADWFGHMFMTDARADAMIRKDIADSTIARLHRDIQHNADLAATAYRAECEQSVDAMRARNALRAIEAATRDGKSGTARKINRMATEALK